jgi:D-glycerate 3-kinase
MTPELKSHIESFMAQEKLPAAYLSTVEQWFLPMVEDVLQRIARHQGTYVIGVTGCQGSGKSTLAALVVMLLNRMLGLRCVSLSIDDFYLTHARRQELGATVHPLLATRGVPGTHDVDLALTTLLALKQEGEVAIPQFSKAMDDRIPEADWPRIKTPVDVIVLEGWCLSVDAQTDADIQEPLNELEAQEDSEGRWRRYVNEAIQDRYMALYAQVDYLIMLKAPTFEKVFDWRQTQEDKLAEKCRLENVPQEQAARIMSPAQLRRFIQHYERVTRHGLETLPHKADVVFQLTDQQTIDKKL